ncbi:MAG TPA: phosphate ABC transporter permease PstA [Acidobacteriaceae bacterium]|nr:phosphate ABC transporter permease PstA [Acidobacteriaceae bacterium]
MATTAREYGALIARPPLGRVIHRRLVNYIGWALCTLAFLLLGSGMVWILVVVFLRGFHALTFTVMTHVTQGVGGGLLNAIEGTALLAFGGILLAVPPGMAAGIYLSEYDKGPLAPVIRFFSDVLVGVPSIVVGYFGYVTMVAWLGWGFSVAAGSIALAIISLPYITRTTEMALRQVPRTLREAGLGLGITEGKVIMHIIVPMGLPGILTGILLAFAISMGETAPLIYTAGWSNYLWNGQITHSPIGYLTYAIWAFITEPFASANALAYAAALLVTLFVLLISVVSRMVLQRRLGA